MTGQIEGRYPFDSRYSFDKGLLDLGGGLGAFLSGSDAFGLANAGSAPAEITSSG